MTLPDGSHRKRISGYTDKLTVRSGERIEFRVSVEGNAPYTAQLVRLINGDIYSKAARFKEIELESPINGRYQGHQRSVALGSCIVVGNAWPLDSADELTVAVNFMPTMLGGGIQHLIGRWDACDNVGWSLQLNEKGQLSFVAANRQELVFSLAIAQSLTAKTWYAAALRVSWRSQTVRLDCHAIAMASVSHLPVRKGHAFGEGLGEHPHVSCPLLMAGAFGGHAGRQVIRPVGCFNGRLEAPVIYQGLLSDDDLSHVFAGVRPFTLSARLIADWDFSDDMSGTQIKDRSSHQLDGYIHNLPLRAVKGSRWKGTAQTWPQAPDQYAAIHFHSDDLSDCRWPTDISYQVPNLRSGIYALRLRVGADPPSALTEEYLPFFVAAPKDAPHAKVALLVPTYTYLAYGNCEGGGEVDRKKSGKSIPEYYGSRTDVPGFMDYSLLLEEHPEFARSAYDLHQDGSAVQFSSWLRPLLNLRPKSYLWTFCADLLLIDWLEHNGFEHDIITDDLLEQEGVDLLKHYRVVITGNHPEYCTTRQLDAVESFLAQGGRLMYLGGNGWDGRVATHHSLPGIIELRREQHHGPVRSEAGETALALSGEVGNTSWQELGRPPQRLVGVGIIAIGFDEGSGSYYRILPAARHSRAAFILEGVEGDIIGDSGIFEGGAAGQEIDSTNAGHGTPAHAVALARSENHGPKMLVVTREMKSLDPIAEHYRDLIFAEVTFFETRNGGAVFSVGSISWCGSLSHNGYKNNVSTITANVLNRFMLADNF